MKVKEHRIFGDKLLDANLSRKIPRAKKLEWLSSTTNIIAIKAYNSASLRQMVKKVNNSFAIQYVVWLVEQGFASKLLLPGLKMLNSEFISDCIVSKI